MELGQIRGAAARATRLTDELLSFSRRRETPLSEVVPAAVLRDIAPLLVRLVGADRQLVVERAEGPTRVLASAAQIEQVLFNLVSNARDASPRGGEIVVACRPRTVPPGQRGSVPPGEYVELSVQDHGAGISEEVRQRMFEPFFTTKAVGSGTGLGLSTCQAIATKLGGRITVESELGRGSTFALLLPVHRPVATPGSESPPASVLVTDAEPAV